MPGKKRILIIDDDQAIAADMREILTASGYDVYAAVDGQEGIGMLKRIRPQLVLLDLVLPDLSGFQVAQKIKSIRKYRDIPLVAVSLKKDAIDKHIAAKSGFLAYIEKPIDTQILLFQVNDIFKNI